MNEEVRLRRWHVWLGAAGIAITIALNSVNAFAAYTSSRALTDEQIAELQKESSSKAEKDVVDQQYARLEEEVKILQDQQRQNTALLMQLAEKK